MAQDCGFGFSSNRTGDCVTWNLVLMAQHHLDQHLLVNVALLTIFLSFHLCQCELHCPDCAQCVVCHSSVNPKTNSCMFLVPDDLIGCDCALSSRSEGHFSLGRSEVSVTEVSREGCLFPDLLKSVSLSCGSRSRKLIIHLDAVTSGHKRRP